MVDRRRFLVLGAASAVAGAAGTAPNPRAVKTRRVGKVEIAFKSPPGSKPNGLQATTAGLWIIDQGESNKAYLVSYEDGKVLRSFGTETDRSSGITFDDGTLWIGSTYSREIVRCDAVTGKTLERHFTPGAGVIYQMAGDPMARSSPLAPKPDQRKKPGQNSNPNEVGGFQAGQLLGSRALGTGAHGQEVRDGKLWMAVPPARMIFCLDPKTWVVEKRFETAGNRPHGIGWEGRYLWVTD